MTAPRTPATEPAPPDRTDNGETGAGRKEAPAEPTPNEKPPRPTTTPGAPEEEPPPTNERPPTERERATEPEPNEKPPRPRPAGPEGGGRSPPPGAPPDTTEPPEGPQPPGGGEAPEPGAAGATTDEDREPANPGTRPERRRPDRTRDRRAPTPDEPGQAWAHEPSPKALSGNAKAPRATVRASIEEAPVTDTTTGGGEPESWSGWAPRVAQTTGELELHV